MPILAAEGLSSERLCRLAARCARDATALEAAAGTAFAAAIRPSPEGRVLLDGATLRNLPDAIALRVVSLGLERLSPQGIERLERLERLVLDAVLPALHAVTPLRRTLRAALVEVTGAGDLTLSPAPPRRGRGPDRG
jgi:tRNA(Ile)-lysidine synthase